MIVVLTTSFFLILCPAFAVVQLPAPHVGLSWRTDYELVQVQAYGKDTIRVRFTNARGPISDEPLTAVLQTPELPGVGGAAGVAPWAVLSTTGDGGNITNGAIRAVVENYNACCATFARVSNMRISFFSVPGDRLLTQEFYPLHGSPPREMMPVARGSGGLFSAKWSLAAQPDERFYGLGQHQHGLLNQRGAVIDFDNINTEVSIPLLISSRGYAVLWSVPSRGRVELATNNRTRFVARATRQIDALIIGSRDAGDIFPLLQRNAEATGHAPMWPSWASGYWQCRDRYASQAEVLNISAEFKARQIPVSMLIVDMDPSFSPHVGDWKMNPKDWPNPSAMVQQVKADTGAEMMVSVWPELEPASENYGPMHDRGLLAYSETGGCDNARQSGFGRAIYDPFNPDARDYFSNKVMANHYSNGIRAFWLDADEGSGSIGESDPFPRVDTVFSRGSVDEIGMLYPYVHQLALFEAMSKHDPSPFKPEGGSTGVVLLTRAAWAGSQRVGAVVWSGDIEPTWASLNLQLRAGLNMMLSGLQWWTLDIGGYSGGDPDDEEYRELYTRWFQYGCFLPIMRAHGSRPHNEPWSYGAATGKRLVATIRTREALRPYIDYSMQRGVKVGRPIMRPLFVDFPQDDRAIGVDDAYMFGDALLVAPILAPGLHSRTVYLPSLPKNKTWVDFWDRSQTFDSGKLVTVDVTMDSIPVFVRTDVDDGKLLPSAKEIYLL